VDLISNSERSSRRILSFKRIATVLATLGILALGAINIVHKRQFPIPEDGASWKETAAGVMATSVDPDGPAERAGIRTGDILRAITANGVRHEVPTENEVARVLFEIGVLSQARYSLERNGAEHETDLVIGQAKRSRQAQYMEAIGLLYFFIGLFVLVRQERAAHAFHFYSVCLISFVAYTFDYSGALDAFDWIIFWMNRAASSMLPPLLLHFYLAFPHSGQPSARRRASLALLYAPGALLFAGWIALIYGLLDFIPPEDTSRILLEDLGVFHFGGYFILSATTLAWTLWRVRAPEVRRQLKWITLWTAAAVPYFLVQMLDSLGLAQDPQADLALLPLALIPISFAYAILRYRLIDVGIIFKRGATYTLATASVVGLYALVVALAVDLLGASFPVIDSTARYAAIIVAAVLFAPIKDQFQVWLDKFFYRGRYDVRQTLIDFGKTFGSEVHMDSMLDGILDRLSRALLVDRAAIFLEDTAQPGRFTLARANGAAIPPTLELNFTSEEANRPHVFMEKDVAGLHYFVPCHVKDRPIGYIGLGRTSRGAGLTSEDLDLVQTVSDYAGIAIENARLYRSLEQEVFENQNLKDFSENIIESIDVGVAVEDERRRVAGWNRALEQLTGISRSAVLGRRIAEVIPGRILDRLAESRQLYKYPWNGSTVNFSSTPLIDKSGATRGALIIVDDITDRVRLENQLTQNEKLTSIGLLAAGVAHEVNTPLAVISNCSQILRKAIGPDDPRFKLLEKITKQTFRASEIVNGLLSFSRTSPTQFAPTDIHTVIDDTLSLVEHQFSSGGIQIERAFQATRPITQGNGGRLQQVFLNLFLNAKDAMPAGGRLRVRTRSDESRIEVFVDDTGAGIAAESLDKIYDPFFTTKTAGKGTGLGLSVSYGIVQEHGGSIAVESRVGEGSSFRLEFPLAAELGERAVTGKQAAS
jgi:PAS domain S-box-containing protein